jgi:general secretion pathway protein E/type IV pilus assembly protein PilB
LIGVDGDVSYGMTTTSNPKKPPRKLPAMSVSEPITARRLTAAELARVRTSYDQPEQLDAIALELGYRDTDELLKAVGMALGVTYLDLTQTRVDTSLLEYFPIKLIHRHQVFPVAEQPDGLLVAVANPFDVYAIDAIDAAMQQRVMAAVVQPTELQRLIKSYLGVGAETVDDLVAQQSDASVQLLDDVDFGDSEDAEQAQEASVVRLVNEILKEAIDSRASDIHIEAQESGLKIRYRVDGVLQRQPVPTEMNRFHPAIISRLKIMARLNIAEKRVPQDGRIKLRVSGREIDVRVSVIPMLHGEGIVMRVLDKENLKFSLRGIGMPEDVYAQFRKLITLPHGIVLVTGPTGSGKTTTLYSALEEIRDEETKIITTEDPIEYQLEGINQIQVHAKVGLTFAASLRSILRHDPDVVLVGEIRDLETAENAVQASLTGHLVFSTLHTNDSAGAFMRLCDMGVEPFLVTSTVEGIMAQRLVRQLCANCRQRVMPVLSELPEDFPLDELERTRGVYEAVGCRECRQTGYRGRTGLYELLVANDAIRALANERTPSHVIKQEAIKHGMRTLRQDGWQKVLAGITTIDEVLRVTKAD